MDLLRLRPRGLQQILESGLGVFHAPTLGRFFDTAAAPKLVESAPFRGFPRVILVAVFVAVPGWYPVKSLKDMVGDERLELPTSSV